MFIVYSFTIIIMYFYFLVAVLSQLITVLIFCYNFMNSHNWNRIMLHEIFLKILILFCSVSPVLSLAINFLPANKYLKKKDIINGHLKFIFPNLKLEPAPVFNK